MSSQKPSNHLCKIRICCLIGKLIFVIPWETGKRAGASKAKTGTSGLMMLDQMSRNKCSSSHYAHNWETGKIAPLEQWGTPTNTPGTALDNRGGWVGVGRGGHIGRVDGQRTTMQLIMPPIVLSVDRRSAAKFCAIQWIPMRLRSMYNCTWAT